jgi:hypothetical protein
MRKTFKIGVNQMQLDGKLPAGDRRWPEFNDAFANRDVELLELANAIYTGHSYACWHEGRRKTENFICGQHIAIDMDCGDEQSSLPVLQNHKLVRMYGSIIHTTPSHTQESPRARIIFLLDRPIYNAAAYQAAAKFWIAQFPGADSACSDASRFFYGSQGCDIWFGEKVLPVTHLRHYFAQQQRTQPAASEPGRAPVSPSPSARPAANGAVGIEQARELLARIDPWKVDYKDWVGVIAALYHEFGDSALSLAEGWAQGAQGEVQRMWRSMGNYNGQKKSIASIIYLAKQRG